MLIQLHLSAVSMDIIYLHKQTSLSTYQDRDNTRAHTHLQTDS